MTPPLPRRRFLGVDFTPLTLAQAVDVIRERPADAPFVAVVTPNAHHVVAARRGDPWFLDAQAGAWMVLNDSRVLRRIARLLFGLDLPLAPGSDLVARLFAQGIADETAITLIGGGDEVEQRLRRRYGLSRIARHDPQMGFYRDPAQIEDCLQFVRAHPARYVFFVAGAPQSEMLATRLAREGAVTGVGLCVGSALNFLTGVVHRAPPAFRLAGLEWLYRLGQRPLGHARRVFIDSAPVLWIALRERFSRAPS